MEESLSTLEYLPKITQYHVILFLCFCHATSPSFFGWSFLSCYRSFWIWSKSQWGGVGSKNRVFVSTSHSLVLSHSCPAPHDKKNFLALSPPLRASWNPAPPRKTLHFVNLPTIIAIIYKKTYFISKNVLEIKNKFIPSNSTNFWQKLNNIIKVFNKTISQQKQKYHNTKSMIQ